jgi:hypothetical protein
MGAIGFYAIYAAASYVTDSLATGCYIVWQLF